jgi:mannose-6-phosphate isomerase
MQNSNKIFRLEGVVQHYAWGGNQFIPALLNQPNKESKPFAEYWMGAHDNASAKIQLNDGRKQNLNEFILKDPIFILGEKVYRDFGKLPYLLKILDVKDMLSIQVHPDKESARKAFEEENKKGIPLNAPNRNYKDANHKPELMLALSDFWLLHGFKQKDKLLETLKRIPELKFLIPVFNSSGYEGLYKKVMKMSQPEVDRILKPLLDRIIPLYKANNLNRSQEDFWAARGAMTFNSNNNIDRGIFSIYFFNLVHCKPGEAVFQKAGVPHAYLEGQNVEIMSNSDNVLRGGLTPKHIDVQELMKHIEFEGMVPDIVSGDTLDGIEKVYKTPAPDFQLSHFELQNNRTTSFMTSTADILFVEKGQVKITKDEHSLDLKKGEAAIIFNNTQVHLSANDQASVYRATVPIDSSE